MVFQEPTTSLNPVFTIGYQIEEVIRLHQSHLSATERREGVLDALKKVRIADPLRISKSYPHELSGGMRQRAMIAMALSGCPDLLIADEATTALDVTVQAQVLDLLRELQQELGMALLLITHDVGIIAETVDRVVVMQEGRVVEQSGVREIFRSPQHAYTQRLMEIYGKFDNP